MSRNQNWPQLWSSFEWCWSSPSSSPPAYLASKICGASNIAIELPAHLVVQPWRWFWPWNKSDITSTSSKKSCILWSHAHTKSQPNAYWLLRLIIYLLIKINTDSLWFYQNFHFILVKTPIVWSIKELWTKTICCVAGKDEENYNFPCYPRKKNNRRGVSSLEDFSGGSELDLRVGQILSISARASSIALCPPSNTNSGWFTLVCIFTLPPPWVVLYYSGHSRPRFTSDRTCTVSKIRNTIFCFREAYMCQLCSFF